VVQNLDTGAKTVSWRSVKLGAAQAAPSTLGMEMDSRGSKNKGSSFERTISRKLSLLVSGGERTDCFWRSALSGGRATLQLDQGILNQAQAGDISAISREGLWLIDNYQIECKHYADLEFTSGFLSNTGVLHGFWKSLVKDSLARNKYPLLIAKQNNRPIVMMTLPHNSPAVIKPIITLHNWPAEVRLFSEIEKLVEEPRK
jgi:hypothetical protein